MSAHGMVDVDWECPHCHKKQTDSALWAANRARDHIRCCGCDRWFVIAVSVSFHPVEPPTDDDSLKETG